MSRETKYKQNPDFIYRKIVDESVLLPIKNNVADMDCIYTLNDLGAFLWEQLSNPASQYELEDAVLAVYDADREILVTDLENFIAEMVSIGALQVE